MALDHDSLRTHLGDALTGYLAGRPRDMPAHATDPNEEAFARYRLVPRLLGGQTDIDLSVSFAGMDIAAPIIVGAFAGDRVFASEGILPIARATAALGLPLMVSEECLTPLAEITAINPRVLLQMRAAGSRERTEAIIAHAAEAGAHGLLFTALAPVHPRPGFFPGGFDIGAESARQGHATIASIAGSDPVPAFPAWDWSMLADMVSIARQAGLVTVLKGVLAPEDAPRAAVAGCAAAMVSNLGVRNLYRWAPSIDRLAPVRQKAGALPLLLDGGVRNGGDIVVACALGAAAVALVRPVVAALVTGGEASVHALLRGLIDDVTTITCWMGVDAPSALTPDQVVRL